MSHAFTSNTPVENVRVSLAERSYDITIGTGNLPSLVDWIQAIRPVSHVLLVSDSNVAKCYVEPLAVALQSANIRVTQLIVPAGEESKSVDVVASLWEKAIDDRADRKSVVVALGGGVIGDLAGFVAASLTRGLDFFQVPTTLLAQVDSSVGGKVGINLPTAKNIVGAFWQPKGVLNDTETLKTLPPREYLSGLAEVVKYGVIMDEPFFEYLEQNRAALVDRDPNILRKVIARCCELKAQVVSEDEKETTGRRAILNYGHTFCHALETVAGYGAFLHGEAVSIGMLCASRLGESLGVFTQAETARQYDLLTALGLPVHTPELDESAILSAMRRDKKVEDGNLRFIVPHRIGEVVLTSGIAEETAMAAWRGGHV